jgi:hypothetical protein
LRRCSCSLLAPKAEEAAPATEAAATAAPAMDTAAMTDTTKKDSTAVAAPADTTKH